MDPSIRVLELLHLSVRGDLECLQRAIASTSSRSDVQEVRYRFSLFLLLLNTLMIQLERRLQNSFWNEEAKADIRQALPALYDRFAAAAPPTTTDDDHVDNLPQTVKVRRKSTSNRAVTPKASAPVINVDDSDAPSTAETDQTVYKPGPSQRPKSGSKRARNEDEKAAPAPVKRSKPSKSKGKTDKGKASEAPPVKPLCEISRDAVTAALEAVVLFKHVDFEEMMATLTACSWS